MTAPTTEAATTNPFVGPHALSEHDELFGRTLEVRMLRDLVIAERIVLLYSPSGAGKTSLLHAGLKRELVADGFAVLPTVRVTHESPDALAGTPVRNRYSLSTLLSLEAGRDHEMDPAELATTTLDEYLELTRANRVDRGQDCLFFDQFEELFTADPIDVDAKREFLGELGDALRNRSRWAIISMREDFAAHLDPYLKLFPTRLRATFRLDLLGPQAAKAAILGPMRSSGVTFDDAAVTALVDDLRTVLVQRDSEPVPEPGPTVEPVQLQVVCRRLWSLLDGATAITTDHMNELGNVDHALRDFYDEVVGEVIADTGVHERVLRAWITDKLITDQGYRSQVQHGPPDDASGAVLPALENAHLVRADRRRNTVWYELAHDRLVDPIRHSNDDWLDRNLSDLQRGARAWEDQKRSDRALFVGPDLVAVESWAAEHPEELGESEEEFLEACRAEQRAIDKDARTRRRTRILAFAMTAVAVVAVVALVFSFLQWRQVEEQRDEAEAVEASSAYFFGAQSRELDYDVRQRLLLDAMALEVLPEDSAPSAHVMRGINTDRFEGYLSTSEQSGPGVAATGATAMSPDGSVLAVAVTDGVRVIDLDGDGQEVVLPMNWGENVVSSGESLALSSTGSQLAAMSADGRDVQLWDLPAGTSRELESASQINQFDGPTLSFVADDRLLVALGVATATVWDVAGGVEATPSALDTDDVSTWFVSSSGTLVVRDTDGLLHLVDIESGAERSSLAIDGDVVAADATAARIVVTDYATMSIVDTATGTASGQPIPFAPVVTFVDDGSLLTIDGCVVRTWTDAGAAASTDAVLPGCRDSLFRATPSANGDRLLLEGYDVGPWWSVVSLADDAVLETSAVPEGQVAAGGTVIARVEDERVVIRSPDDEVQATTRASDGAFRHVAVDAGGHAVVAATDDRLALIDPATGEVTATAQLPWTPQWLAVGGQGAVVAAVSDDGEVVRWRTARDDRIEQLDEPDPAGTIGAITALGVTGRSGSVVVARHDEIVVHTDRGSMELARGLGEITRLATADTTDLVAAVASAIGPTTESSGLSAAVHVWPDGRPAARSGVLELAQAPDTIAVSARYLMVATGITSDVYNVRAIVSNAGGGTSLPQLEAGHNDLSSYYGLPGLSVADVAIDDAGGTPRFLWVPTSGAAFAVHADEDALLADIVAMAEAEGFEPLDDSECVAAAGIPCL